MAHCPCCQYAHVLLYWVDWCGTAPASLRACVTENGANTTAARLTEGYHESMRDPCSQRYSISYMTLSIYQFPKPHESRFPMIYPEASSQLLPPALISLACVSIYLRFEFAFEILPSSSLRIRFEIPIQFPFNFKFPAARCHLQAR